MDTMEIRKLFTIAIRREVEAHEFYQGVAEKATNDAVKEIFEKLAKEEMDHRDLLEKYEENPSMEMKFERPPVDYRISETVELPKITFDMKPAEAIALAMKKEQQAVEFYRKLAASASDEATKQAFEGLADMELEHKQTLENAFIEVGYPESF